LGHCPQHCGPFPGNARCNAQGSYAGRGGYHPGLYPAGRNQQRADQGVDTGTTVCALEREALFERMPLRARQLPDGPRLQSRLIRLYGVNALIRVYTGEQFVCNACERIDIIEWSEDPAVFAANALSPAKVSKVEINSFEEKKPHPRGIDLLLPMRARAMRGRRECRVRPRRHKTDLPMQSPHVRCWGNNGSRISVLRLVFRRRLARARGKLEHGRCRALPSRLALLADQPPDEIMHACRRHVRYSITRQQSL